MQWLKSVPNFNFMKYRRVAMIGSAVSSLIAIFAILFMGLNFGIDFTGGVIIEVRYPAGANLTQIRSDLEGSGLPSVQVQNFGSPNDVLIRLPPVAANSNADATQNQVMDVLRKSEPNVQVQRIEAVGPQVGENLAEQGGRAMLFALILIFIYVMIRFRWKLAVGAIVATVHDIVIVVGAFALFGWQFDLTVLGSVLAVLGWSLNDTVVLYDRVRDNFRHTRRGTAEQIVNSSVNQTLSRTINTGVTTLLVLVALYFLGGDTLWGFSVALIIGIIVGTYSSIYIASAMALVLDITPADLVAVKAEKVDDTP